MEKQLTSIFDVLQKKQVVKEVKTKDWQFEALEAIEKFPDGKQFTGSIFKAFRDDPRRSRIALADALELNKPFARYFLKVYNALRSQNKQIDNK